MKCAKFLRSLGTVLLLLTLCESSPAQIGYQSSRGMTAPGAYAANQIPTGYLPPPPSTGYRPDPYAQTTISPGSLQADLDPGSGSLWSEGSYFNSPFDFEPVNNYDVGDHIVVIVQDNFRSREDMRYENETESTVSLEFAKFLFKEFTDDDRDLDIEVDGSDEYEGTSRGDIRSTLSVEVPTEVKRILPDGRLMIEGRTSRMIGRDIKQVLISGILQPEDVDYDTKTVDGSRVLDMQVKWEGNGPGQNVLKPGFINRFLDYIPIF